MCYNDTLFDLKEKTAVVTGASSGLGAYFAELLAERGANVVLAARRQDRLNSMEENMRERGMSVLSIACDVDDSTQVHNLFEHAEKRFGRVDIAINNAGQIAEAGIVPERIPDEKFEQTIQTNIMGLWYCCKEAGQRMLSDGLGGSIINMSPIAGLNGMRGMPAAYQASKGAVTMLTKNLASNWGDRGVRVNAIAPGWFSSEMTAPWIKKDLFLKHISANAPMGRIGEKEELAGVLILLCSDASSFINGEIISVDGGMSASLGMPFFTEEMFEFMESAIPNDGGKRLRP